MSNTIQIEYTATQNTLDDMARAEYESYFTIPNFEDITAGIVKWPMSVIRLQGTDIERISECADHILNSWVNYTDEDAFIYAYTDGVRHNAITPIARRTKDMRFELDLVLRNNITTDEFPLGVYHPHQEYHHLKKENIGLIEVMGLAILPARLKTELADLAEAIDSGADISGSSHAAWAKEKIIPRLGEKDTLDIIKEEVGIAFSEILECAGVSKDQDAFMRFVETISI